jgi:shikimate kinase
MNRTYIAFYQIIKYSCSGKHMKDIILTGPKHSGKTSAGKALASLCSCDFIDIDELILQRTGKSPRQLFSEDPEIFKKAETEALTALADSGGVNSDTDSGADGASDANCAGAKLRVIAAGGGIIDNSEALSVLKKSGAVMAYLDISAESAWGRIAAEGELPPFLRTENPQETHRALHERRATAYLQIANIVIKAAGKSPQEIAAEIFSRLN